MRETHWRWGSWYRVITPAIVTLPIMLEVVSANHMLPSAPATIPPRPGPPLTGNSVTAPVSVIRPILFPLYALGLRNYGESFAIFSER